ncbi:outer membrane protein assembly factor BamB family protein [Nocardiopsis alborubida]|uniref:PQQ-binding-like beta-propeller repeat protein n=1 Tax=Nocardiopsis alborubida TaxID=146802 RepID=A0A7X6RSF0_9ACTN|nr:PQQ-binding-like beta-propeller repeat protein [Nocardiopsis alborubida]NKZ00870.1 PQQ-binding-like beta-propeller repeat protein [Nocardiopsis alborubida]
MRRRVGDVLGWSGVTVLVGALILTTPHVSNFSERAAPGSQGPALLVGLTLLLAAAVLGWVSLTATRDPDRLAARPTLGSALGRGAVVLVVLAVVWAAFPTRHLAAIVDNDGYRMFSDHVLALWVGVCLVALGTALALGAATALPWHRWKRVLTGAAAGTLVVTLVWTLVPAALTRAFMVEHTVAAADGGQAAPVPATISRVGWTWEPEHPVLDPVLGVERGPRGPLVLYDDGFVALDGATGEELWTYRLPFSRQAQAGVFAGQDRYAYLSHVTEATPESEPQTHAMVMLDAATGEVVRETPMPALTWQGQEKSPPLRYLTPDVRVFRVHEDGRSLVVAYATDSTERLWEVELREGAGERWCQWADDGGIRGHGDRVLVARLCLDQEHLPEEDVESTLYRMDVPEDAVESVTALDVSTGERVWRQEWTPDNLSYTQVPIIGAVREGRGGEAVARTPGGAFAVDDGAPAQVFPPAPDPMYEYAVGVDTRGAVVLRDRGGDEPGLLLVTDASGEVVQRSEVEVDADLWAPVNQARVLESVLVVPHLAWDDADRRVLTVSVLPWEGEAAQQGWTQILLEDGEGPVEAPDLLGVGDYGVLPVPGAVVSHVEDRLYGLVP